MQFKSKGSNNPKVHMTVDNRPDGAMELTLCQGRDSGGKCWNTNTTIPVGKWFHLEAYYVKSTTKTGRVTFWMDGQQIVDATGVDTANSSDLGWSVISYGTKVLPNNNAIYADDAAISTARLGPN
jgi:hypothetical protein